MTNSEDLQSARRNIVNALNKGGKPSVELEELSHEDLWNGFIAEIINGTLNMEEEECLKAMMGFLKNGMCKLVGSGSSGLHLAVMAHNECLVRKLLKMGAVVDARDDSGATPLYVAIDEGQLDAAAILLGRGASVDSRLTCFFRRGYTPLHAAALRQDADAIRLLVLHGAALEARDETGATPLYTAVEWGHVESAKALIASGADVNASLAAVFKRGYTGLHVAAEGGRLNMVTLLLENGADPNLLDSGGASALRIAMETDHFTVAEEVLRAPILKHSAAPKDILHIAAARNRPEIIRLALEKGVDVDSFNESGQTALHIAADKGFEDIIRYLLKGNADLNLCTPSGYCALHFASGNGRTEAVKLLLDKGSNVNLSNALNVTALHEACFRRRTEIVSVLLENGANVDSITKDGKTPLLIAVENRFSDIISELLYFIPDIYLKENKLAFRTAVESFCIGAVMQLSDYGFHFDENDAEDPELLWTCVENGYVELVKDLMDHEAKVTTSPVNNKSLLHCAMKNNWMDLEMTELLISYGLDVNGRDVYGQTPLFYAVATGRTQFEPGQLMHSPQYHACRVINMALVTKLISNGAHVSVSDCMGTTPLHIAVFQQDLELSALLLKNGAKPNRRHSDGTIPLHIAVQMNNINLVRLLLLFGSNINCQDVGGVGPLHLAVRNQNLLMTALLIEEDANIEMQLKDGSRPIHLALTAGGEAIVELLLNQGADYEASDFKGRRPLHIATSLGLTTASNLLLKADAAVNVLSVDGRTPLYEAVFRGDAETVAVLLAAGADPDQRAADETPLHAAVARHTEIMSLLLKAGADVDAIDSMGQTPLLIASRAASSDIAELLLKYGANPFVVDFSGQTPLEFVHIDEPSRLIDRVVRRAIAIRSAAGFISESFFDGQLSFHHQCLVEVDFIRAKPLVRGATFHSVLSARLPQLTALARHSEVQKLLDIFEFEKLYPVFGCWIRGNLQRGAIRNKLIVDATLVLQQLTKYTIPEFICRDIVEHLDNSQLREFNRCQTFSCHF